MLLCICIKNKGGDIIYSRVYSEAIRGIEPYVVCIEVDITNGIPVINMVGLLSSEVKESKERVRTALKNSGNNIPPSRVTISFSPANEHKEGTGFDLAIAVAILNATNELKIEDISEYIFIGELRLDGSIKGINGILPLVNNAKNMGYKYVVLSDENYREARLVKGIKIIPICNLNFLKEYFDNTSENREHIDKIRGDDYSTNSTNSNFNSISQKIYNNSGNNTNIKSNNNKNSNININNSDDSTIVNNESDNVCVDYKDIFGQEAAKYACVYAACGWHNLFMIGPPGSGKSILARGISSIMDEMSEEESIEVSNVHSICGLLKNGRLVKKRPFYAPHHSITLPSLIGGGKFVVPGAITIANKGVLFLDELTEFQSNVLDGLRQPLEEKSIKIHRLSGDYVFPADCLVVAATNPCKCGYYPDRSRCNCTENEIKRYFGKVSGPILDRMDISVEVSRVSEEFISYVSESESYNNISKIKESEKINKLNGYRVLSTYDMKKLVKKGCDFAKKRQGNKKNANLTMDEIRKYCYLGKAEKDFMMDAYVKFGLTMRGYYKVIKVSRTIADIEESESIEVRHLIKALAYRLTI